jgi:anti-anti-sigma factor
VEKRTRTSGALELEIVAEPTRIVIQAVGELDLASQVLLARELARAEANPEVTEIVLDLAGLTFMDSSGLNVVIQAHARSQASQNRLRIRAARNHVAHVLDIAGVIESLSADGTLVIVHS